VALDADFLAALVCPENREPLSVLDKGALTKLNTAISKGQVKNRAGEVVKRPLDHGLRRADGKVVYPVWDDIPNLLVDEGLPTDA